MGMVGRRDRIPHYDDAIEVGRRLHDAREAAGLSQRELAFPGCSAAYISRIERGERIPSLQVMRQLALRIGITEEELSHGERRLHPDVERSLREVEDAESGGRLVDRAHAYAALGRTAAKVARALENVELSTF
jgi:transcriptional regulator with XRE-family HTH domain